MAVQEVRVLQKRKDSVMSLLDKDLLASKYRWGILPELIDRTLPEISEVFEESSDGGSQQVLGFIGR